MSFRVIVVDDERLARLGLIVRLRLHDDMQIVAECENGLDAVHAISTLAPDLIFLDIQLPDISGVEVLRSLPRFPFPRVVFLTAHQDYAVEAFNVHALDYLLKPVDDERFLECLDRARRNAALRQQPAVAKAQGDETSRDRFTVRSRNSMLLIRARDVDWLEALGDYTGLHVGNRTHLLREPISSIAERLDKKEFIRVHRSAIVRVERLRKVEKLPNRDCILTLQNGQTIRASRTYTEQLYRALTRP
jgi:two-component system, LytTR family, response regulator